MKDIRSTGRQIPISSFYSITLPTDVVCQDLISRFTLDCATAFLFGADVRSLSAGLAYPRSKESSSSTNHSANVFARAFLKAQIISARRGRYGTAWPLYEFWKDDVAEEMKTIDAFIMPLLHDALRKKDLKKNTGDSVDSRPDVKTEEEDGEQTLLGHLVNLTDGITSTICTRYRRTSCPLSKILPSSRTKH